MKAAILCVFLFASLFAAVFSDDTAYYAPEAEYGTPVEHGARHKRHVAALPFLAGVAAGGIFGPILYNRLYGWRPTVAWKEPVQQGWQPEPVQQGWQPAPVQQGWQGGNQGGNQGGYN
jgi:hypothetical protein